MKLDVRLPMGLLFLILGLILLGYGWISDPAVYVNHPGGRALNLQWGTAFAVFGGSVLGLWYWARS